VLSFSLPIARTPFSSRRGVAFSGNFPPPHPTTLLRLSPAAILQSRWKPRCVGPWTRPAGTTHRLHLDRRYGVWGSGRLGPLYPQLFPTLLPVRWIPTKSYACSAICRSVADAAAQPAARPGWTRQIEAVLNPSRIVFCHVARVRSWRQPAPRVGRVLCDLCAVTHLQRTHGVIFPELGRSMLRIGAGLCLSHQQGARIRQ